jgi:hypothetical protein
MRAAGDSSETDPDAATANANDLEEDVDVKTTAAAASDGLRVHVNTTAAPRSVLPISTQHPIEAVRTIVAHNSTRTTNSNSKEHTKIPIPHNSNTNSNTISNAIVHTAARDLTPRRVATILSQKSGLLSTLSLELAARYSRSPAGRNRNTGQPSAEIARNRFTSRDRRENTRNTDILVDSIVGPTENTSNTDM